MISSLSADQLRELTAISQGLCVSIYMPTVRLGAEIQQNPIRFKNLIKQAESQLQTYELSPNERSAFLQPALDLDTETFWQYQSEGLAIFIAEGFFRYYQLPLPFAELVVVAEQLHLKPLLPLLTGDGAFYILLLNQQRCHLFEASRYSIHEIELEGVPQSLEEALAYDETAKTGQNRISTSRGGTSNPFQGPGSFHGQGSPDRDKHQQEILQYFHIMNRELAPFLSNPKAPLILVGVEYLLPLYREANTFPTLLDTGIPKTPDVLDPEELRTQAWAIAEPHFIEAEQQAIAHYYELVGTGRTTTQMQEAIPAAYYGRVDQLFVPIGIQQWGTFDPQDNKLDLHRELQPGDEDLLNAAAIQTLLNGGRVFAVQPDQVPDDGALAAVFRY